MRLTLDQVRARIKRNFPEKAPSDRRSRAEAPDLMWALESAVTKVSTCYRYRISKVKEQDGPGVSYWTWTTASETLEPKMVAGPFKSAREAMNAADAHNRGLPVQANL